MKTLRKTLSAHVHAAVEALQQQGALPADVVVQAALAQPKLAQHGDWSTPIALSLARAARCPPRQVAQQLEAALTHLVGEDRLLSRIEIAGPGHLNFFVSRHAWLDALHGMLEAGDDVLVGQGGAGRRVLLEYVSANPTGPLHVAHGRGAVHGDVLARMLRSQGTEVVREYYVNDMGHQTDVLARSMHLRYRELCGEGPLEPPEEFYPGAYVGELAQALLDAHGRALLGMPEAEWLPQVREAGIEQMLQRIRRDLHAFGCDFDAWMSEQTMAGGGALDDVLRRLHEAGHTFEQDGKIWFRSTTFGDDKDRVVRRDDGRPTYFLTDLAYHDHKMQRGFDQLINIWGADHGGYVARVKAGMVALGHDAAKLDVVLMQMVSLSRGGEAVRMGKRLGTAVWLDEVIDAAGADATRFMFTMRRTDTQMDFDIDLAMRRSIENPVYYAQMGHARLCAIERRAASLGVAAPAVSRQALEGLVLPEELALIAHMARVPDVVADASVALEPHQLTACMQTLIAAFHSYYSRYKNTHRVVSDDAAATSARLLMCRALRQVLRALLVLLGVDAPEQMALAEADPAAE